MSEEKEIPKGWEMATLKDLLDYIQPKDFIVTSTEYDNKYNTPVLTAGKSFLLGYTNETFGIFKQLPAIIFDDFTTAIKWVNFPFKVKSSAMKILVPTHNEVNMKYVYYFMETLHINTDTHKRYWISVGAKMNIPIPPLPEQHRIVAKIEELFSSLDKGIESLKTAQAQLKVYRQAVLKWAFEGKLTNKDVKEGELPEGWRKFKVKELGKVINGDRGKNYPSRAHYVESGVPFISAGNVEENRIDTNGLNFITQQKYDALNSGKLQNGDLIYCLRGSLGKCAIFNLNIGAISSSLCILRLNNKILNQYVFYYLISPFGRDEILKHDNGTAQPNLSAKSFENFDIVLPSLSEQQLIVSEIEKRLSVADKLEEIISNSLQQAESLRQSISKKAFEGKLVPQDPNDEPASVLLERIKAEREKTAPAGRKVNSKKKTETDTAPAGRKVNSNSNRNSIKNQSSIGAKQNKKH